MVGEGLVCVRGGGLVHVGRGRGSMWEEEFLCGGRVCVWWGVVCVGFLYINLWVCVSVGVSGWVSGWVNGGVGG